MKIEAKEDMLDKLVQQWACKQRSAMSLRPAQVGHHIVRRNVTLLRWDILNIMPLTNEEHRYVHQHRERVWGCIEQSLRPYLMRAQLIDFRNYLLKNRKTYNEFLDEKLVFWKGKVND